MKATVTQFAALAVDANGFQLPLGKSRIACQMRATDGAFTALDDTTRFIRVATDTSIHLNVNGGATTAQDELIPAGAVEYFAVNGGETLNILTA